MTAGAARRLTWGGFARLLSEVVARWFRAGAEERAAAIAFNALLSLAPLLLLLLKASANLLGSERAQATVVSTIEVIAGPGAVPAAEGILNLIVRARGELLATALGVLVMLHFSSAVFVQLRSALNQIWKRQGGIRSVLMDRALSLVFVPVAVLAFLVTMALGLLSATSGPLLAELVPNGPQVRSLLNAAVSFGLLSVLLAFLFRHGPSAPVRWGDVWGGALLTSALFSLGNLVIGWLLGQSMLVSLYGAAGSLVVVLLWVYYWAQILLFGAHFTRVYAERYGSLAGAGAGGDAARGDGPAA